MCSTVSWDSAKESYLKYTGAGLAGGLGSFSVADRDGLKTKTSEVEFYRMEPLENYSLCLCAASIPAVQIHCADFFREN